MEEQELYSPETEESPEGTPEVTGEQEELEVSGEVEEVAEPTPAEPEEKLVPLKAVQEERRKRQELKAEMDYWRKVATGELENPTQREPNQKPTLEQFADYDQYVEALADYKAELAVKRIQQQQQQLTREQLQQREEAKLMAKVKQDAEKAQARYQDFSEVVSQVVLPDATLKALYQSDNGADIAYYLGKNPHELDRLMDLPLAKQVMELGKLEVKVAAKTANPREKEVRQATRVEAAGSGFPAPKQSLSKLREEASRSGNWEKYLEAAGHL